MFTCKDTMKIYRFLECMGWNDHGSPGEIFADLLLCQVNEML